MQDGLGSVRLQADADLVVDGVQHFTPYGVPFGELGTIDAPFGFIGEQTDGNRQVYLRARHYNPDMGVFGSLDSVEGALQEAMLLNRYSYVIGNPINQVDKSGMIPERDKITVDNFEYTYSCDCGWIDWKHANPQVTAIDVINYVWSALVYLSTTGDPAVAIYGSDIEHSIHVPLLGPTSTYTNTILISSEINSTSWLQVAMAIFREIEYAHENSVFSHLSAFSTDHWTQFAEEDLTSNLIAFYRALDPNNWSKANAMQTLSHVCRFPSDVNQAQNWSLQVFDEYGDFRQIGAWESPRLHTTPAISSYCGNSARAWPSELSTIQPNYDLWNAFYPGQGNIALSYYLRNEYPDFNGPLHYIGRDSPIINASATQVGQLPLTNPIHTVGQQPSPNRVQNSRFSTRHDNGSRYYPKVARGDSTTVFYKPTVFITKPGQMAIDLAC